MNSFLLFLFKSTFCLSLLYLAFSVLMRKDTFFRLSRMVLLMIVISSVVIPFLYSPQPIKPLIQVKLEPVFQNTIILEEPIQNEVTPTPIQLSTTASNTNRTITISPKTILLFVYLFGVFISLMLLLYSLASILVLFQKARKMNQNGLHLRIVSQDTPAFSFGRYILISQYDYDFHSEAIITHEQSHIRLGHFYDLMLMELAKIIFWFNPLVYRMISDLKEVHEFQADDHTLHSGIDATQYQLLIIQKCVGHQKFALANSFNHCQIKNRITMMNKQKTSKAGLWKVATFLPLLALLLVFCGRKDNNEQLVKGKHSYQLDTTIFGKRLMVKDTTKYSPSFIKELKEGYIGYEKLRVNDDSLIIKCRLNNSGRDTVVMYKYTFPTSLELNKEIVFTTKNKDKSFTLILKRTNYTNLEYQIKEEGQTIKSGIALLQSSFYFGDEIDYDNNGKTIALKQYIDSDQTQIKVEIDQAKFASITYCVDQKAQKFATLTNFLRN